MARALAAVAPLAPQSLPEAVESRPAPTPVSSPRELVALSPLAKVLAESGATEEATLPAAGQMQRECSPVAAAAASPRGAERQVSRAGGQRVHVAVRQVSASLAFVVPGSAVPV